ncbi:MAG: nickel pincer cofactor biosynthesis protein LarC [Actinomycetota bacterium]|nr:nickel pincer cofactor biosynthesis protein LarC [Actinomycetota bacterium]
MICYFDCVGGAAGDMVMAALIDAGADVDELNKSLSALPFDVSISVSEVMKRGIRAKALKIEASEATITTLAEARAAVMKADLGDDTSRLATSIFERLAAAEAKVHGVGVEEVHFHELSAIDTVVDVVGTAIALSQLGITKSFVGAIPLGHGIIASQHGPLPSPGPATLELLVGSRIEMKDIDAETVTPTGAAILSTVAESSLVMPQMDVAAIGYGAGTADFELPNVIRAIIGEATEPRRATTRDVIVEANIDDMVPEIYEHVMQLLFAAGAVDVWITPVIGKRGRPANIISAIAPTPLADALREVLIAQTSTIGVRSTEVDRLLLERRWETVEVAGRPVRVKIAIHRGKTVNVAPEYADCVEVSRLSGIPLKDVYSQAMSNLRGSDSKANGS